MKILKNLHTVRVQYSLMGSILLGIAFILSSCEKLVDVAPPVTSTTGASLYNSDPTAISAVTSIYAQLSSGNNSFATGNKGLSFLGGLSSDEFNLFSGVSTSDYKYFYYTNSLYTNTTNSTSPGTEPWSSLYYTIYNCNAAIDGLSGASPVTPAIKKQLLGESQFMRAFCYFYVSNLYGDAPLALGIDYKQNSTLKRSATALIYQQIIKDLIDAKNNLSDQYLDGSLLQTTGERVRPSKWAAIALLARVYLYIGEWEKAETEASNVINNSALYTLNSLNAVFLKESVETIWALQPVNTGWNTEEAKIFILPLTGPNRSSQPVYLSSFLLNSFETGDQRKQIWIDSMKTTSGKIYYYPAKYKIKTYGSDVSEYLIVLRLAEQHLIRAEARVQQGMLNGKDDLNIIRRRAGLTDYAGATDKNSLLKAILRERQVEFLSEWGNRWFDLKRTNNVDAVMPAVSSQKGGIWSSYKQWYPLPARDLETDPNLHQNTGY